MLKLQSYGVPILHLISNIYGTAARNCLSAHKHFGLSIVFHLYHYVLSLLDYLKAAVVTMRAAKEAQAALKFVPHISDITETRHRRQRTSMQTAKKMHVDPYKEEIVAGKLLTLAWESARLELAGVLK